MKKILVSGTSGIVGYGILRSLRRAGKAWKLIGTAIYEDSVAPAFCDVFEKAPHTNDSGYINWLLSMIAKHEVDLIIPGIEIDLYKWVEHASVIKNSGSNILLNNLELIRLCKDKWLFYQELQQLNFPYSINTSLTQDFDELVGKFGLPFLLKPRSGFGSKGIVQVTAKEDFDKHKEMIGNVLMAQPIMGTENEEYTTSAFCDGNGGFFAFMTLKRKLSKDGFTEKAEVVDLKEVEEVLTLLCRYFKPIGPTNFQFRKHNDKLRLLEINPRVSSSTSIRSAFGYNECQMAVEYFLENKKPVQPPIKQGRAVRYIDDFLFFSEGVI